MELGHNDADVAYCGLCDWRHPIRSVEGAEFLLGRHLLAAHGRTLRYRVCTQDGKTTPIPDGDVPAPPVE